MSAIGHHFIPQYLLRGFAHRQEGDQYYVHVLRKGAEPFVSNVANVAKARYFHGRTGNSDDLEHKVAVIEGKHATFVQRLRGRAGIDPCEFEIARDLLLHLAIRTSHVRQGFKDLLDDAVEVFEERLTTENPNPNDIKLMIKTAKEELDKVGLRGVPVKVLEGLFRSPVWHSSVKELFAAARMEVNYADVARNYQWRWLDSEDFDQRRKLMEHLSWSVCECSASGFILGDVGPLALFGDSAVLENANIADGRSLQLLLLPISTSACLVGRAPDNTLEVSTPWINDASAALSREFFVSASLSERERRLHTSIGDRAELLTTARMHDLLDFEGAMGWPNS